MQGPEFQERLAGQGWKLARKSVSKAVIRLAKIALPATDDSRCATYLPLAKEMRTNIFSRQFFCRSTSVLQAWFLAITIPHSTSPGSDRCHGHVIVRRNSTWFRTRRIQWMTSRLPRSLPAVFAAARRGLIPCGEDEATASRRALVQRPRSPCSRSRRLF